MQFQISSRRENRQRNTRVINIKFREKFSANNFTLSDAEDNTFVENTISSSPEVMRAKFLGSNGLFCFTSIMQAWQLQEPFCNNY